MIATNLSRYNQLIQYERGINVDRIIEQIHLF